MTHFLNFTTFLPIVLFFTLWLGFPVWLALRRSQGLIRIEKTNPQGEKEQVGMFLELGIFIFVIPFTVFFLVVSINLILSFFVSDIALRFQKSLESAFMIMAIALFLYIYAAERKIYLKVLENKDKNNE